MTAEARYSLIAHPYAEGTLGEVDAGDLLGEELGAEALGLLAEPHHQLGAHDPVGEAGKVLDVGGQHQLATGLIGGGRRLALDHERGEVGARRVDRGGQPGRTRADDDHVAHICHDVASDGFRCENTGRAVRIPRRWVPFAHQERAGADEEQPGSQVGEPDPTEERDPQDPLEHDHEQHQGADSDDRGDETEDHASNGLDDLDGHLVVDQPDVVLDLIGDLFGPIGGIALGDHFVEPT